MAVGGSPRLHRVGATVDEQLSHARWQALSTDFGGEFVCGLCARIGGDDLPEGLGGAAAAAPAEHVQPVGAGVVHVRHTREILSDACRRVRTCHCRAMENNKAQLRQQLAN